MNLWGRMGRWTLVLTLTGLVLFGCENPSEIGAELNPNDDNFTTLFKEFTLPSSVVLSDSVTTDHPLEIIVGVYDDPNFGKTKVITYSQLGVFDTQAGAQLQIPSGAVFDSAKIFLHLKYFVGDNFTQTQKLKIHTLRDTLFDVKYKSTYKTPISPEPIAELEFNATAGIDTLLILSIQEDFGTELLDFATQQLLVDTRLEPLFQNNVIPGLAFVPDDNNTYILAIEDDLQGAKDAVRTEETSVLRIWYHLETDTPIFARSYDYAFGDGALQHTYVEYDRSASILSGIPGPFEEYTPSNGLRYIQPINGINTKVDMSEVWYFIDSLDGFLVNHAEFEIAGVQDIGGSDDFVTTLQNISLLFVGDDNKVLPDGLRLFNSNNNVDFVVLDDGSYNSSATSNPLRIAYIPDELLYRSEVSNYIQAVADSAIDKSDIMIYPLVANVTNLGLGDIRAIDQLIFDASKIKLKLFYSTIQ